MDQWITANFATCIFKPLPLFLLKRFSAGLIKSPQLSQIQHYTTVDPKQWVDSRSVLRNRLKSMRNIEKPPRTPIRP
jgi:hypothetical protein